MITLKNLTKRFGHKIAVDNISINIPEGKVVGFLGPNGAGKTTTMNMILGLEKPTAGEAKIDGKNYVELKNPLKIVGAVIGQNFHRNRSPRAHLEFLAAATGIPHDRVDEVLELTGLTDVAEKPVG
ncbi:ATP-binding cassette domain-containing protein, partial [Candidatus Saccharibacteria bacterium]|nr:ATP-binding cassette domain-containing protein [Candidatus Saccharibacteria bacterium]